MLNVSFTIGLLMKGNLYNLLMKNPILLAGDTGQQHQKFLKISSNFRQKKHILTPYMICVRASEIYNEMCASAGDVFPSFIGNYWWFTRFKKRFGLKFLKLSGEKESADVEAFECFKLE